MLRRLSDRVIVNIDAEIILKNKRYKGVIENISNDSILFKTSPENLKRNLSSGKILHVEFIIPTEETLNLPCKVIWSNRSSEDNLINIALEISEISLPFEEFYKSLYMTDAGLL